MYNNNPILNLLIKTVISAFAVMLTSHLLSGVHVDNFLIALLVAVVLSFLNSVFKPILILLTIPITLFSFGLFLVVINAIIIMITDYIVDGFKVDSFWWALLFSIILSFVTWLLTQIGKGPGKTRNTKDTNSDSDSTIRNINI